MEANVFSITHSLMFPTTTSLFNNSGVIEFLCYWVNKTNKSMTIGSLHLSSNMSDLISWCSGHISCLSDALLNSTLIDITFLKFYEINWLTEDMINITVRATMLVAFIFYLINYFRKLIDLLWFKICYLCWFAPFRSLINCMVKKLRGKGPPLWIGFSRSVKRQ